MTTGSCFAEPTAPKNDVREPQPAQGLLYCCWLSGNYPTSQVRLQSTDQCPNTLNANPHRLKCRYDGSLTAVALPCCSRDDHNGHESVSTGRWPGNHQCYIHPSP